MHGAVFTVQKVTFCTYIYGASGYRMYSTAIKIQLTFQHLRKSCLLAQAIITEWKEICT